MCIRVQLTNRWAKVMRYSTLENLSVSIHGVCMMGAQYTELNSNITTAIDLALSSMLSSYSTRGTALPLPLPTLPTLPAPATPTLPVVVEGEKEGEGETSVVGKTTVYFSGDPERDLTHLHLLTNALTRLGYPWHTQLSTKDRARLVELTTTLVKAVSDKPHTHTIKSSIISKMTAFIEHIRQGTTITTTAEETEEVEKEVVKQYLDRLLITSLHLNPTK